MSLMVDRWAEGWAACREKPLERDGAAWLVRVGDEHREVERVVESPSPEEARRLVALSEGPRRWLTVLGEPDAEVAVELGRLRSVSRVETMMTARLTAMPRDRDAILEERGDVATVALMVDGVEAARGTAGLSGDVAVLDRISTDKRYRRRGLGRRVVDALSDWAVSRGADAGALVASPEGRALYLRLGWADLLPVASYAGAEASAAPGDAAGRVT
ncbi:GNAT family N-acetyltransferase [Leucobacter sp. HNU]|uniref:GNAT family N-acetyltransferase n=1 Tax=Leucobacter sp. HNU TaxID=3236805 RepID=UPI003A802119